MKKSAQNVPKEDLISRKAAIEAVNNIMPTREGFYEPSEVLCELMDLPSVQPERKKGKWIYDEEDFQTKCSECGCHPWFGVIPTVEEATKKLQHCPNCGAYMKGENDG